MPDVPVELGREPAAGLARAELADPAYQGAEPSLLSRVIDWSLERFADLNRAIGDASINRVAAAVLLIVLLVGVVALVRYRLGPTRRTIRNSALFAGAPTLAAAEHRAHSIRLAASGEYALAVRERVRAIIRELEERDLITQTPGRTADEAAIDAGRVSKELGDTVGAATLRFDEIWYGGRDADLASYELAGAADDAARAARVRS